MKFTSVDKKKTVQFLVLAYLISWIIAIPLYLFDISALKPLYVVIAAFFMWGPAIATFILQKGVYKRALKELGISVAPGNKTWKWCLYSILFGLLFYFLSALIILLFGNTGIIPAFGYFDLFGDGFYSNLQNILSQLPLEGVDLSKSPMFGIPPYLMLLIIVFSGISSACTLNLPFMFGEEFGWRGFLQKATQPMGFVKSSLLIGIFWGLWHSPLIIIGHNYPSYPYIGILFMCLFTIAASPIFTYVRIKSQSIIAPCILHGMVNSIAQGFMMFVVNGHELIGSVAGLAGVLSLAIISLCIFYFDKPFVKNYSKN